MQRNDIVHWLAETDPARLETLRHRADCVRRQTVGDAVYLRGLVEFSNHCARQCAYCGLRASNRALTRYRMTSTEILDCAHRAVALGYGTVVLQSGEDASAPSGWMAEVVERIKSETPLAVTLSLGERPFDDLALWRRCGADRYLLRFETSDPALFDRIHPGRSDGGAGRIAQLRTLRELGYEVGSGVMIGIPGQTYESLARDIEFFAQLDLDMIGVGPFIAHPATPLGQGGKQAADPQQVPNTKDMTLKALALARLVCPSVNLPSTTALAALDTTFGRESGLQWGGNIIMPNLTPTHYRSLYEIYPGKPCLQDSSESCAACCRRRIESIGRFVGDGPGTSPNWKARQLNAQPR